MSAFSLRALFDNLPVSQQTAHRRQIEQHEEGLRNGGFGPQRTADEYRRRLTRLCLFLLELEWEGGKESEQIEIVRLQRGLERRDPPGRAKAAHVRKLEDLRDALREMAPRDQESQDRYFGRLRKWSPLANLSPQSGESKRAFRSRREALASALSALGVLASDRSKPEERPLGQLWALRRLLTSLEREAPGAPYIKEAKDRWQRCFEDCAGDWEWAYLQVLIRLGRLYLDDSLSCEPRSKEAMDCLEQAIERLERKGFLQARSQGLYGLLAGTCLALTKNSDLKSEDRLECLHKALTYAQHAVEMEPESVRERLKLIEVLSALEDYEEMKAEAEIALALDSSSETLKVVGKNFWRRISSLHDRRERRRVLQEAEQFFRNALTHVESDPFDRGDPLEQVRAHGWAHFWLGRFLCESGDPHEGAIHLRTSRSLGFKPLESRVELAWAYLLERNPEAEQAFCDAVEEAKRQSDKELPRAAGEERPTGELKLEAYLGWAFLWADRDPGQAKQKLVEACKVAKTLKRGDDIYFRAVVHEAQGRIALKEGGLKRAIEELEQSLSLRPRSGAFCALASAKLQQARYNEKGRAETLRQAREAHRLAHENDLRGRYRYELADILRQLRQMEKTAPKPV